jgi:hypothetical protein
MAYDYGIVGEWSKDRSLLFCESFNAALQAARLFARWKGAPITWWIEKNGYTLETAPAPDRSVAYDPDEDFNYEVSVDPKAVRPEWNDWGAASMTPYNDNSMAWNSDD